MSAALLLAAIVAAADGGQALAPAPDDRVRHFAHYVGWVLDLPLSEGQLAEAAEQVARADGGRDAENKKLVDRAVELDGELEKETPAELARLRPSVEDEYLKRLAKRSKGRPAAEWILKLKASARTLLRPGNPPLLRQTSDCLLELAVFVATRAGAAPPRIDAALREGFSKALSAQWPAATPAARASAAAAPAQWQRFRAVWAAAPEVRRQELDAAFRQLSGPASTPDALVPIALASAQAIAGWN